MVGSEKKAQPRTSLAPWVQCLRVFQGGYPAFGEASVGVVGDVLCGCTFQKITWLLAQAPRVLSSHLGNAGGMGGR